MTREALEATRRAGEHVGDVAITGPGRHTVPFRDIQITDLSSGARGAPTTFPDADSLVGIGARCSRTFKVR